MKENKQKKESCSSEGARRATGDEQLVGPLSEGQRWTYTRKREVVLRMLRGESLQGLSRELAVEIYRLEQWREKALNGLDESLKSREGEPLQKELDEAMKRIGEITMENELLRKRIAVKHPLARGRRKK